MHNLLSAGFSRLWKNKLFLCSLVLMPAAIVAIMLNQYTTWKGYGGVSAGLDTFLPGCFLFIGCFAAVFSALFLGTEYSDGVIRNKLIAGHSRDAVYLSSLCCCIVFSLLVCAASVVCVFIVGVPLFGLSGDWLTLFKRFGCGILLIVSFSALFTLPAMLLQNKAVLSVFNTICFFGLLFAAIYVMARLEAKEFLDSSYAFMLDGEYIPGESIPNPGYLRGTTRTIFEFLGEFLPTGQSFHISQMLVLSHPLRLCLYSLTVTVLTTAAGLFAFRRKDIN